MGTEQMDKATVRRIAAETQAALAEVAARHGLTVTVGGGRYDPQVGTFRPKVEFAFADAERKEFELTAAAFGIDADVYGSEVTVNGRTMKVVALNTRAPKYPLICEASDGKRFKVGESVLNRLIDARNGEA